MTQNSPGREGKQTGENKGHKSDLASEAKDAVQKVAERVKETATDALGDVREQVRDGAASMMREQQRLAADKLDSVCEAIHDTADRLRQENVPAFAGLIEQAADQIESFSHYIRDQELSDMVQGAQTWIRRNPAIFLGGSFVLGMLVARVIKSTQSANMGSGSRGYVSSFDEGESSFASSGVGASRFSSSQYGGSTFAPSSGVSQGGTSSAAGWEEP